MVEENLKKNRNIELDIVKGISIILMVWGHCIKSGAGIISKFNMPVFFMISGVFFKECISLKDVFNFSIKKLKSLYFYYICANLFFLIFHNLFIKINIYTDNDSVLQYLPNLKLYSYYNFTTFLKRILFILLTIGGTQLGSATWFFRALLFSSILYAFIDFLISKITKNKKIYFHIIIGFVFILIAKILSTKDLYIMSINIICYINQVLIAYFLFPLGKIVYNFLLKYNSNRLFFIISFICSFIILIIPLRFYPLISEGDVDNFLVLNSISGFIFLYDISSLIKNKQNNFMKVLTLIGQNTVYIVTLHFLSFKLVNYLIVKIEKLPLVCVAGFSAITNLAKNNLFYCFYGFLYILVGVFIPLLIGICIEKIKKLINK